MAEVDFTDMEVPFFISFFAEKIGKPVLSFTKDDWRSAAIKAAEFLDKALPIPGRPGRPRKKSKNRLYELLCPPLNRPVGRPRQTYGKKGFLVAEISELMEIITRDCNRRNQTEVMRLILRHIGGHAADADSVLRSVRTYRKQLTENS